MANGNEQILDDIENEENAQINQEEYELWCLQVELALAHVNQNEVEAAYQRSDLFERRRDLMTSWGNYCKTIELSS